MDDLRKAYLLGKKAYHKRKVAASQDKDMMNILKKRKLIPGGSIKYLKSWNRGFEFERSKDVKKALKNI